MKLPTPAFPRKSVLTVALGALVLRLWFNLLQHPLGQFLFSDMGTYHQRATNLLDGTLGPWDTFTPVGYPAFVALIYGLTGRSTVAVGVVHALLGAATCWLAARLCWSLNRSRGASIAVGALMAVYLPFVSYGGLLMSETLSAFLAPAGFLLLLRARDQPTWGRLMAAGFALAVSVVVRPYLSLLYPLLGLYFFVGLERNWKRSLRAVLIVALASLPVFSASAFHNSRLIGRFNLFGTNGGLNFFLAHSEYRTAETRTNGRIDYSITPIPNSWRNRGLFSGRTPLYEEAFFYRKTFALIAERPSILVRDLRNIKEGLGLGKTRYWPGWQNMWWLLEPFNKAFFWLAALPSWIFLASLLRQKKLCGTAMAGHLLCGLLWIVTLATLYLFLGDPRVRVPFDPVFIAFAADAWRRLNGLRRKPLERTPKSTHFPPDLGSEPGRA